MSARSVWLPDHSTASHGDPLGPQQLALTGLVAGDEAPLVRPAQIKGEEPLARANEQLVALVSLSRAAASARLGYFEIRVILEPWIPVPPMSPAWLKTIA